MFRKLLGLGDKTEAKGADADTSIQDNVPGIVVKSVIAITDETKPAVIALLKHAGTLAKDNPALLVLKRDGLKATYQRAASGEQNYLTVGQEQRVSAWYRADDDQLPDVERSVILKENRSGPVFQPRQILTGGSQSTFAMIFEPPCCEDEESVLICFNQGANFSWKLALSETALIQNVGEYFRQVVQIGRVNDVSDRRVIEETLKHLNGTPCACNQVGNLTAYREPA